MGLCSHRNKYMSPEEEQTQAIYSGTYWYFLDLLYLGKTSQKCLQVTWQSRAPGEEIEVDKRHLGW